MNTVRTQLLGDAEPIETARTWMRIWEANHSVHAITNIAIPMVLHASQVFSHSSIASIPCLDLSSIPRCAASSLVSRVPAAMSQPETKSQSGSMEKAPSTSVHDIGQDASSELDLLAYHEHNAGRLVVDPE